MQYMLLMGYPYFMLELVFKMYHFVPRYSLASVRRELLEKPLKRSESVWIIRWRTEVDCVAINGLRSE